MKIALQEETSLINELQDKLKKHEEMYIKMMTEDAVLNKKYNEIKRNYENMTSSYSNVLAKLKQSYEKHKDFNNQISELEAENYKLSKRAAVAFDDLTPRPNIDCLFEELEIPISKNTTVDKANILYSSIQNIKKHFNSALPTNKNSHRRSLLIPKSKSPLGDTRRLTQLISADSNLFELDSMSSPSKTPLL